jgi:hypothetical protein
VEAQHFTHGKPLREFHKINQMNNSQPPLEMKLNREVTNVGEAQPCTHGTPKNAQD